MSKAGCLAATVLVLVGCGGPLKYNVRSSNLAPGADAKVVAEVRKDLRQTLLEVEAENLPPPARISEGAKAYAVWYRKDASTQWVRIGNLDYDEGDREGKLQGSVPELEFELEITAEEPSLPVSPSPSVVFAQRVGG